MTQAGEIVQIIEDLGAGRKRFVGLLVSGQRVRYFRNGRYANHSTFESGHPLNITSEM